MFLVPLFWGGSFSVTKNVINEIPIFTAATIQFGISGVLLLFIMWLKHDFTFNLIKKHWIGLSLMAITGIFAYNFFFFQALMYTSAINGSLIMAITPILTTVGAVLFLKEKWDKKLGFGLTLSLAGVFLVIINGSINTLFDFSFNLGDLLFFLALICWVLYGLIGKVVLEKGISPLLSTTVSMLMGSLLLFIPSLFENHWTVLIQTTSVQSWFEMIYLVVFGTVIAFFLWNKGIHQLGASKASIYMNLVPVNTMWISFFIYNSPISWVQIVGISMVLFGVLIVNFTRK
ncbi:EamA family transporter [Alkalihalobacillus sp. MEB130]|uniref:DMT family transporter n=1 Tax=Alkalihalobacillus sp. MEB130 TaxID=2976704 RepID=UPI0028E097B3|nr:EamA family transporter [Alkalihalobacillus sp. MEB130]MDT8862878.1 EamA family transporter [Alkalihalobacillus sp. MEB130]